MSETGWDDIELALHRAVVTGCAIPDRQVIWDYYTKAPRPAPPFVEMSMSEIDMQGEDWIVYDDAPDPVPGAELRKRTRGIRSLDLTLQAFAPQDGVGNTGGSRAWPVLTRFLSALADLYADLDDAGIGVGDVGPVQSIPGRHGGVLEPRARLKLQLYVGAELESRETFIERAHLRVRVGPTNLTLWIPDPPP